jgi:hypothetical protein
MLLQPGVPQLPAAWASLTAFIAQHTPPGAQPVLAAHNGFTFDFKMLAACLLRARMQQQQQQPASNAAPCSCNTGNNSSCSSKECEQNNSGRSSSSAALKSSSCCELPEGMLTLDSLVLARRLNLKQQAGLDNIQQGTLGYALMPDDGSML